MGCTQSDPISVPFWKPATVLKIETIQGWDALRVTLLSIVRIPKALTKVLSPAVWK